MEFSEHELNLTYYWTEPNISFPETLFKEDNALGVFEILYCVLEVLIVLSNLWLTIVILLSKELSRQFFYCKVLMCVLGDLLLCISIPFAFIAHKKDFWKSEASCQLLTYYLLTYNIFIPLAVTSLLLHPILTYVTIRFRLTKITSRLVNVVSLFYPLIVSFVIFLPVSITFLDVTWRHGYGYSYCTTTGDGRKNVNEFNLAVYILMIAIIIPALIALLVFVCIQCSKLPSSKAITLRMQSREEQNSENKPILDTIDESDAEDGSYKSQILSTMVMSVFTWLCTVLYPALQISIMMNHSYFLPEWAFLVHSVFIFVYFIPAAARPYFWLINSDMRANIKTFF